jgi:Fe-S oxidoreductase
MLSFPEKVLFIVFAALSLGLASVTFARMFRAIGRGADPIDWSQAARRWREGLSVFLTQKTLFKTRPWVGAVHAAVAWGFTLYILVNIVDVFYGFVPDFHFLGGTLAGMVYRFIVDLFSVLILIGVVYFLLRRFLFHDPGLETREPVLLSEAARRGMRRDSLIVGLFIFLHVGFRFLGASFEVAAYGPDSAQPAANLLAGLWSTLDTSTINLWEHISWWGALGLILAFVPYFPYSKHAHLFMGPLNYMSRPVRRSPGTLEKMDFEDEDVEQLGVVKLEDLPQTELLDAYACIMCSRCQDMCPAYVTKKELSPSALEINKRYFLNAHLAQFAKGQATEEPLTGWMLTEEAVWSCTTCGFCAEACPVGNEPFVDVLRIRQNLVMMESRFPQTAMEVFEKMETYGNPWGLAPQDREKWMEGEVVPRMREKGSAEVLYWTGCAGAYDTRGQEIARSMVKVLNAAQVDFACLGNEETCTGDSARRMGNEYLFQIMAEQNIENFRKYGIKKVVTQCPHCMTTLKNDYAEMGLDLEVQHHSQFIADLIRKGELNLSKNLDQHLTYHDPCYLGRHNGEYQATRDVLQNILTEAGRFTEMERNREQSFCCGAGGGQMWYEIDKGKRINVERFEEAARSGATTVTTACNFCMTMLEDGMKVTGNDDRMRVKDLAELVSEALEQKTS